MNDTPQQPLFQIALTGNDWQVIRTGLYELPIKVGLPTLQRLEQALAEASRPIPIREEEPSNDRD